MKTVGILGGGQLGCMLSEALFNYGAKVIFYDPEPRSPSFHRSAKHFCGAWNDRKLLEHFFSQCDVVTYEFENVAVNLLTSLINKTQTPLYPSENILAITQNRIQEKNFLLQNNFPVCFFKECNSLEDFLKNMQLFSFPYIIKTVVGGYDGKGQWLIHDKISQDKFITEISANEFTPYIIEEKINIFCEASCIVARNLNSDKVCLPIFDNIHKNQILFQTHIPSHLPENLQNKLTEIAIKAADKLNVIGLLTTEFFITKQKSSNKFHTECIDGFYIYVNEFAPRPHNSGHISRNACTSSQYDLLARVLLNIPLHTPKIFSGHFCMENMLGNIWLNEGQQKNLNLKSWQAHPNVTAITLYGKEDAQINRKMGHFICHAESYDLCNLYANNFREELNESKKH